MSDLVATGLVTATEFQPAPTQVPAAPALPAAQMPDGWTLNKVASLVLDVAQNMYDLPYILKKHGLTVAQYDVLKNNEFFQRALEARTIEWHSASNTQKRLALESAIAVEDALPTVAARLSKTNEPLSDVVALLKVLSEIAGAIGNKAQGVQATGEKFKIVINLGADTVTREATPMVVVQQLPGETGEAENLLQKPQGTGNAPALQPLLEAAGMPSPVRERT